MSEIVHKTLKKKLEELEKDIPYEKTLQFRLNIIEDHVADVIESVPRIHPDFTLHGLDHSRSVISNLDIFCQLMDLFDENNKKRLSKYEIFLLLSSTYLHDIGMILIEDEEKIRLIINNESTLSREELSKLIRKNHHIRSAKYIERKKNELHINTTDSRNIGLICEGHGEWDLTTEKYNDKQDPLYNADPSAVIRARFLTALLQIADELDISCERAPDYIREVLHDWSMDRISQFHWMKHYYTGGIIWGFEKIGIEKKVIITVTLNVPDDLHGIRIKTMLENRIAKEINAINQIVKQGCDCSFSLKPVKYTITPGLESTPEDVFWSYFLNDEPLKILLIEDDEDWQEIFKILLSEEYSVVFAHNEISARDKIKEDYFHLIVLDLHLPDKEGYYSKEVGFNLLRTINKYCFKSIVIVLTAWGEIDDLEKMKESGIIPYSISKLEFYKNKTKPKKIIETKIKENLHFFKKYL